MKLNFLFLKKDVALIAKQMVYLFLLDTLDACWT